MKKNRQILVLAALLFSFLCFPADKVLAASNVVEVPLTVKQNFEENSNEKGIDLTGTYEFRALDIGIPMPGDSDNDRHVFVLDGNNAEKMISLQFQHGEYTVIIWFKQVRIKKIIHMIEVLIL